MLSQIKHFMAIATDLATAGQPTEEQFADIAAAGFEIIVNLAMPNSTGAIAHEQQLVEAAHMHYIHIPVVWENPTAEDFARFVDVLMQPQRKRFVHCALNMRVSAFVYLYRRIYEQIEDTEAIADLHRIWTPNDIWQRFIDRTLQLHRLGKQP